MDDFIEKYVLAYFNRDEDNYSFISIAQKLGISVEEVDNIVVNLIEKKALEYTENHMLQITLKGQMILLNEKESLIYEHWDEKSKSIIDLESAWDFDRIYLPKDFLKKLI